MSKYHQVYSHTKQQKVYPHMPPHIAQQIDQINATVYEQNDNITTQLQYPQEYQQQQHQHQPLHNQLTTHQIKQHKRESLLSPIQE